MPDFRALAATWLTGGFVLAACGGASPDADDGLAGQIETATDRGAALALACGGCHSDNSDVMISLEGYGAEALREALTRYRTEADGTTVMHRLARGYSDRDIDRLAAQFDQDGSGQ